MRWPSFRPGSGNDSDPDVRVDTDRPSALDRILGWFGRRARQKDSPGRHRGPATHVIILDGTLSSLVPGYETNAGLIYKLLRQRRVGTNTTVYYEAGVQWRDFRSTWDVLTGRGINQLIRRAYGVVATRYRPGDRIVLLGYSRGAFAARSLSGLIGRVGLLRADEATHSKIVVAFRHYQRGGAYPATEAFRRHYCHPDTQIAAVGVFDTVRALGVRLPIIWRVSGDPHSFHDATLDDHVQHGFHALAVDERRRAYTPELWKTTGRDLGRVEQVWFRGSHGDVGGHLGGFAAARPLSNIPLVWMLGRLAGCGIDLPADWRDEFDCDVTAPSSGQWRGWTKLLFNRRRRRMGMDPSESLHPTVTDPALRARFGSIPDLHHEAGGRPRGV